jgi:hypothetical protein
MKSLKETMYNKIALQAEEAQDLGLKKLASAISDTLSVYEPRPDDKHINYNHNELKLEVYSGLWKLAFEVIAYHDLKSADVQKIDKSITQMVDKFLGEVEASLQVSGVISPLEEKLPGEK